MKIDGARISRYLMEIKKSGAELEMLVTKNGLSPDTIELKAAKYLLIELAEGISNTLQHILAKEKGLPVNGYIDTIVKGHKHGLVSGDLFHKLKPFFDFRNSLVHRYWTIDDERLIQNIENGCRYFETFVDQIEIHIRSATGEDVDG